MDYDIFLAPAADSWKVVKRAEELGFHRAWMYDTQLLNSDVFVSLAAAAMQTSRIRLGTGVLIPSNRIAPVTASALASLNALAPARIDFGISTGFTARRTLGLPPVKLADMEEYVRVVQGLIAKETLEWTFEGQRRKIRFLNPEVGAINVADPIPLHVAANGRRARALTAKLGAGWILATANVAHARLAIGEMQDAWRQAGRDLAALSATANTAGCILRDGEAYDSPRARAQAGPTAMIALHSLVEREVFGDLGRPLPPELAPLLDRYREIYRRYEPADARYLENHRGHLMFLRPEEHEVCSAELIRATTLTGPREELRERVREMAKAGYTNLGVTVRYGHPEMLEEWADLIAGV